MQMSRINYFVLYNWRPALTAGLYFGTMRQDPAKSGWRQQREFLKVKQKSIAEETLLVDLHTRIRDVRVGPEGAVYVLTDGGTLMKLTPK